MIELVPESQAYIDLLAFENKLDTTIMRKRLDIQEALKRPIKVILVSEIFLTVAHSLSVNEQIGIVHSKFNRITVLVFKIR